jgi:hypothetical protein
VTTPPDWTLLAGQNPGDLQTALMAEANAVLDGQPGPEQDRSPAPGAARAAAHDMAVELLDYEVSQGSLLAYSYNRHGRHARFAASMLRRIGANRMADVVAEAAASYERASAEWAARRAEIDAAGEFAVVKPYKGLSNADELGRLTDRYWQAAVEPDWGSKLDIYLRDQVRLLAG